MPGMISAPEPLAVEAAAQMLQQGGNAIDAAVTGALVQAVVNPQMCGLGGYALLTLRLASGKVITLDAPALAGSQVTPTMWENKVIGPNPFGWGYFLEGKVNDAGYQSICTPGTVKALATILARWGTRSWAEVIEPAAALAETGYPVDGHLAARWQKEKLYPEESSQLDYILSNPEACRIYLRDDGKPHSAGETIHNPDYARTLRHLAQHGTDDFYTGELAHRISADLAANDSFVTAADLAAYQVRLGEAVTGTYRGYTIHTAPPPHGGPTLIAMLNILEHSDLGAMTHNSPDYIYRVAMAMKAAFADRNPHMADPEFAAVPVDWMTDKTRAATWHEHIVRGGSITVSFTANETPDTTHLSALDAAGNAVSLTHSLGASSGVITPGLGFMYNNSMINFHPWPGHPNSIAPRKSRTTGMTPTIISKEGQPVLIIGAPGATRIITGLVQVIVNVLDFGMSVAEAVLAPRFDCQGDVIKCQLRIPEYVCADVRRRHAIERLPQSHGEIGLVHAIGFNPATGVLQGGADTGSGGMALQV